MDINTVRGLATLFALLAFIALFFWAYSGRRKKDFDEAASLPFADDNSLDNPIDNQSSRKRGVEEQC